MIQIKTRLHDGIYASMGGGQTHTHYTWDRTGPMALVAAIRKLRRHSLEMTQRFGAHGHQGSWIDVDGVKVSSDDVWSIEHAANGQLMIEVRQLLARISRKEGQT